MQRHIQLSYDTIHILTAMLWYEGQDCLYISCLQQGEDAYICYIANNDICDCFMLRS